MASAPRKGLPTFWATTLAKALSGEQPCPLVTWLSGHYDLEKRVRDDQGNLATWKANHSAQLEALVQELRAAGWGIEKEKYGRVKGQAAILSWKTDVLTRAADRRPTIWDVKSGRPRDSDVTQVLIEMVMIPIAWEAPTMQFNGVVVYPTHRVELKPSDAQALKPRLFAKMKELASPTRPVAAPSRDACRYCDVTEEDCPERFRLDTPDAETMEF